MPAANNWGIIFDVVRVSPGLHHLRHVLHNPEDLFIITVRKDRLRLTEPAKLLAVFVADTKQDNLVTLDKK
ncbi:MAG: hypothetical protein WB696_02145 [Chthoniobacterales bacterium]